MLAADEVEIGEREQAEGGARQVLGDAAVADLGKPPTAASPHVERVLAAGPGPRPAPVLMARQRCAQRPAGGLAARRFTR